MKLSSRKVFFGMIAALTLVVCLTFGALYLGQKILQSQSKKLVGLRLDNAVLDEQQKAIVIAKKDIEKYAELDKIAKAIVPEEKDQAETILQIVNLAKANGITINAFVFQNSTLGQAAPSSSGSSSSSSGTSGGSTTTPKPTTPPVTQAQPVQGIKGVYALPITLQQDTKSPCTFDQMVAFLRGLEQNRRTAQETQITITPDGKNPNLLTFQMQLNLFIKP